MSFSKDIRNQTRKYLILIAECDKAIEDLKAKRKGYYAETFDKLMTDAVNARQNVIEKYDDIVHTLVSAKKEEIHFRFTPKGEDITEDAKLFNSGLVLTGAELDSLYKKYEDNPTMQRIIEKYSSDNGIILSGKKYSEKDYIEAVDRVTAYCRNAIFDKTYTDIIENDDFYNRIVPEILKEE